MTVSQSAVRFASIRPVINDDSGEGRVLPPSIPRRRELDRTGIEFSVSDFKGDFTP